MRTRRILAAALISPVLVLAAGCAQPDISSRHVFRPDDHFKLDWDSSAFDRTSPFAFDVENGRGSVWIEVDEKLERPKIDARLSWDAKDWHGEWPHHDSGAVIEASVIPPGDGGGVVTITSALIEGAPASAFLDIRVRTPRCDGVRVINDGGPIVLVGVGGAITAENGGRTGEGGRIELRTSRPIDAPVALVTSRGPVSAVIAPGGAGTIRLDSDDGLAEFETNSGSLLNVRPGIGSFRAVWNGGSNPIIARTGEGDCHIQVKPNAEMFSVADDWLALFRD
jgi:hypothetical protein